MPKLLNEVMWRRATGLLILSILSSGMAEERLLKAEVPSKFLNTPRTVRIYLPASYHQESNRRYPVVYLHDGQNLFSWAGTNVCFGWGNWELDRTVDELSRTKKMPEVILVGIDNSSARYGEYCGRHQAGDTKANTDFENYCAFLIQELKPRIDSAYRTRPEATNTATMGSSLGGICSIILAWEHPDVFGKAASLSGAFQVEKTNFLVNVLQAYSGKAKPTRLYLDSGVVDFTGGDDGRKLTANVAEEFKRLGWSDNLMRYVDEKPLTLAELEKAGLRKDKWAEAQTSQHNEFYWRLRSWRALTFLFPQTAAWSDVSGALLDRLTNSGAKPAWPGGCSGVVANRLNGEVTIKVVGSGLWRSSDVGKTWQRVDQETVSGRDETGWATSVDQNNPSRVVSFSLDGAAGWTTDGRNWKEFTSLGRNWDFGSVDWAASEPKTIISARHETTPPGEIYITLDGGLTWKLQSVHLNEKRERISMVGALGANSFIYSKGEGIYRSTDAGAVWTKVSSANPQTRIPILFRDAHYLGTAAGLLVSKDQGATWQAQGTATSIWLGPFFGNNENQMVVVGETGIFLTTNAGQTWTAAAGLKSKEGNFVFSPNWFGCYAWDPKNNILYASAMGNPVYKLQL